MVRAWVEKAKRPLRVVKRKLIDVLGRTQTLGTITGVETERHIVALTFDDGPHPRFTPLVLDTLRKHGARATFFMVGEAAERYPAIVRRAVSEGHAIGNHTWDHPSFRLITSSERKTQIGRCADAIGSYNEGRLLRPPFGDQTAGSRLDAFRMGYKVITWSLEVEDWKCRDVDLMTDRLIDEIHPGCIILLHDRLYTWGDASHIDRSFMVEALDRVLEEIRPRYSLVTVPELLDAATPIVKPWIGV